MTMNNGVTRDNEINISSLAPSASTASSAPSARSASIAPSAPSASSAPSATSATSAPTALQPVRPTFVALEVSLELIRALAPLMPAIEARNRPLADQIYRAASSVSLNLGEGQASQKGNAHKHYALANGSASEVRAALRVAQAWGWVQASDRTLAILDRLLGLIWGLTHPGRRASGQAVRTGAGIG
jgi:four helix bundle protein